MYEGESKGDPIVREAISGQRASDAVFRAIEEAGIDHEKRETTLYEYVDLEALNDLFGQRTERAGSGAVRFEAWGYSFAVRTDEVVLFDLHANVESTAD